MKNYELLDAVGGIDAEYVQNAALKRKPRRSPLWVQIVPAAACLCLILGTAVFLKPGTPNLPVDGNTVAVPHDASDNLPSVPENHAAAGPVIYDELKLSGHCANSDIIARFENASADVLPFQESMLSDCAGIVEGEIVNMHIKEYSYTVENDKYAEGEKFGESKYTVVYEIQVDRSWYGDRSVGQTVLIEDEMFFPEEEFALKEGHRYVIPFYEAGDEIFAGIHYTEGDITRDSIYSALYVYHPQIEVTQDNCYIVSEDWPSLLGGQARQIIISDSETEAGNWYQDKMWLVQAESFESGMQELIECYLKK